MNLLNKAGPWVVASFIATASAFAQNNNCCKPVKCCEEMKQIQLMAGYNAPSRVEVRGCWDVYASGSFTYWQPCQDNMEPGQRIDLAPADTSIDVRQDLINQKFNYKPGFKVALGMNFDHDSWDSKVEYTWFRGSDTSTSTVASPLENIYFSGIGQTTEDIFFAEISQRWRLHMDFLDWDLARNYYVGTKLTFRPSFGARAAWIRQNLKSNGNGFAEFVIFDEPLNVATRRNTYSWGVGPRATLNTNWNLGEGFRIFGNGAGDILFTQYTKANIRQTVTLTDTQGELLAQSTVVASQKNINCLRTHLELELGLGWGSFFDCNNWHVDLSAGYGFQVFFDQNMFRPFADQVLWNTSPNGNLYVHGLTATARFDF